MNVNRFLMKTKLLYAIKKTKFVDLTVIVFIKVKCKIKCKLNISKLKIVS